MRNGGKDVSWILLVEPEQRFASAVARALTDTGCATHSLPHCSPDLLQQTLRQFKCSPDVAILDQSTLDTEAWPLCRTLKESEDPPFLIALVDGASGRDRLHAYDCGADDILQRPADVNELVAVVRHAQSRRQHLRALEQQLVNARTAAFAAMSTSSRVGQVVRFMQKTMDAKDAQAIADSLLEILQAMDLQGMLALTASNGCEYFSAPGKPSKQDVASVEAADKGQRLIETESHLIINDKHCVLLVHYRIDHDADKRGQLRDDLCVLVEAIESRICGLLLEREATHRRAMLDTSLRVLGRILEETDIFNREFTDSSTQIVSDMLEEMNLEFSNVDLCEEEEMRLATLLEMSNERLSNLFKEKRERDDIMQAILRKLFSTISL